MENHGQQGNGDHEPLSLESLSDELESDTFFSAPPKLLYRKIHSNEELSAEDQRSSNGFREIKSSPAQHKAHHMDSTIK